MQMEKKRMKLPSDVRTFEAIRGANRIYVDETRLPVNATDTVAMFSGKAGRFRNFTVINYKSSINFKTTCKRKKN